MLSKKILVYILFIFSCCTAETQYPYSSLILSPDTALRNDISCKVSDAKKPFPLKQLLIPAGMIAYGFSALESKGLRSIDKEFKEELWLEHPHQQKHVDNFLQFAPIIAVYGLNAAGIHGKHDFRSRSILLLMSNIISNTTVFSLKKITLRERPDGSNRYSFPSGHTAEAFSSAEFMWQEYKEVSPWYGIAGYAMAFSTGYLRMYNNKHWMSDVVAGAGIGIASTKIAYWLYPKIESKLFKHKQVNTMIMPACHTRSIGLNMVHQF